MIFEGDLGADPWGTIMVDSSGETGRELKIAEIKQQIASGTYETTDKVEAAVEEIIDRYERDQLRGDLEIGKRAKRPK